MDETTTTSTTLDDVLVDIMTTDTTTVTGKDPMMVMWTSTGPDTKWHTYSIPKEETEGTKTLTAIARINRPSMEKSDVTATVAKVKRKLLKELFDKLVDSNVINIASEKTATGGLRFTATVKVSK